MKRLLVVLIAAAAFGALAFGAATAKAGEGQDWAITLIVSPTTMTLDGSAFASGVLTHTGDSQAVGSKDVSVHMFIGSGCVDENHVGYYTDLQTAADGSYALDIYPSDFAKTGAGTYSAQAQAPTVGAVSACVDITVTEGGVTPPPTPAAEPAPEIGVFLCYSTFQVEPGVWPYSVAKDLVATDGYWLPYAVSGNVAFGTNIGGYHLVCNVAATQSVSSSFLSAGENVYPGGTTGGVFGPFYPVVGG